MAKSSGIPLNAFGQPNWAALLQQAGGKAGALGAVFKASNVQQMPGGSYAQVTPPKNGQSFTQGPGMVAVGQQVVSAANPKGGSTNFTATVYGKPPSTSSSKPSGTQASSSPGSSKSGSNQSKSSGSMAAVPVAAPAPAKPESPSPYNWHPRDVGMQQAAMRSTEALRRTSENMAPRYNYGGYLDANGEPSFDNGAMAAIDYGAQTRRAAGATADYFDAYARLGSIETTGAASSALQRAQFSPPEAKDPMKLYASLMKNLKA